MDRKEIHILGRADQMYRRYGIKSVTMDDVAHDLGISKKTLYEFFKDKEDLISKVLDQALTLHHERIREIEAKNLNAVEELLEMYRMIHHMFADYNPSMEYDIRKYYPALFSKLREIRRKSIYDFTFANLVKGKKEGFYRKEINTKIIARLQIFYVENLFDSDLFSLPEIKTLKVFNEFFVFNLQGILSLEGRKVFDKNFPKI
jgi:TetR/AcrR family transcriptional regulator, cholesterol catabolism regulator